ncbi:MAG: hypothetical protein Q7R85_02550 [bacterium]|nr:hypothetical protein [bacterium]
MAEKLKSAMQSLRFGLLLRTAIFWSLLGWGVGGGFFPGIIFLGVATFLYAQPAFNALQFLYAYIALIGISFALPMLESAGLGNAAGLFIAALFYMLLRLKELLFIRRLWWHEALHAGMLYLATLAYFSVGVSEYFVLKHFGLGIVFFLLAYELLGTHGIPAYNFRQRIAALTLTLLFLEIVWVVTLLPIGYASAAGISALAGFTFLHLSVSAASGLLRRDTVAKHIALAGFFILLIAALSRWKV